MMRSRLVVAAVLMIVLAVVVAKVARGPHAAARTENRTARIAPTPAPPAPQKTVSEVLTGAELARCLNSGKPTLADFGEGWCEPCKKQAPVLEATATKYRGKANVVFVDTKAYPELGRAYGIRAIPTQIFFDTKGHEVTRHIGYYPPEEVAKDLAKVGAG